MSTPGKFGEYGSQRGFKRIDCRQIVDSNFYNTEGNSEQDFISMDDLEAMELPFD